MNNKAIITTHTLPLQRYLNNMFANQAESVNSITADFESGKRHVILAAQMQSGKTGTFTHLAKKTLKDHTEFNVLHICPMSDTRLKEQAVRDYQSVIPTEHMERVKILFLQDFKTSTFTIQKNTLIIIDESDRDSSKEQSLDRLLRHNRIQMDGNTSSLESKNYYILSVSATPFAELSDSHHQTSFNKHTVILSPGERYKGIRDFYERGNIKPNFDIMKNIDKFITILRTHCERKYAIVRTHERTTKYDELFNILTRHDIRVVNCFPTSKNTLLKESTYIEDLNEFMSHPPASTTVIVIHNILRAGQVIPKEHIGMVWEGSSVGNTDATLQGLPGRCCGYHENTDIQIFVPKTLLTSPKGKSTEDPKTPLPNEIENYMNYYLRHELIKTGAGKFTEHERKEMPRQFRHTKNPLRGLVRNATTVPFRVEKDSELYTIMNAKKTFTVDNTQLKKAIFDEIQKPDGGIFKETMTVEQHTELKEVFDDETSLENHHRNFTCRNAKEGSTYDIAKLQEAAYKKQTLSSNMGIVKKNEETRLHDIPCVMVCIEQTLELKKRYRNLDSGETVYYVFFRTESSCPQPVVGTTGEEIFATRKEEDIFADDEEIYVNEAVEYKQSVEDAKRRSKYAKAKRKKLRKEHKRLFTARLPGVLYCGSPKDLYAILKNIVKSFKKNPNDTRAKLNRQAIQIVASEISTFEQNKIEERLFKKMGVRIHAVRNRGALQEDRYKGINRITINGL